jgi:regulator of sirC expression with transglutaminase-like and TPR domain
MKKMALSAASLVLFGFSALARAEPSSSPTAIVATILNQPDARLDYGRTKLAFDAIIDPAARSPAIASELAHLAAEARAFAGPEADDRHKLSAVRHVIYDAGPWNGNRPFGFDMNDPAGQKLGNALLSHYLTTRQGNCVAMPVLFLILADQLGAPVHLAIAPGHFLVQYTDTQGRRINIEATSGGHVARDDWIRQAMPMTDRAIKAGVYLRPLSRREAIAHMAITVVDYLNQQRRYAEMAAVAQLIIKNAPLDVEARAKLGTAYAHMIELGSRLNQIQ